MKMMKMTLETIAATRPEEEAPGSFQAMIAQMTESRDILLDSPDPHLSAGSDAENEFELRLACF
ncbi:MAG: hypothetical protein ACYDGR_16045 [Candidatus Dormibacteria bacterium]